MVHEAIFRDSRDRQARQVRLERLRCPWRVAPRPTSSSSAVPALGSSAMASRRTARRRRPSSAQASCLVIRDGLRAPPGLGEPWLVMEVGEVPPGLPMNHHRRGSPAKPRRGWIEPAIREASPCPWPGCPDAIAVIAGAPRGGAGGPWPPAWYVEEGWCDPQLLPAGRLTITPVFPEGLCMTWYVSGAKQVQWYRRVTALPYRFYYSRI